MDFWRNGRTAGAKTGVVTTGGPEIAVRTDMERCAPVVAVPFGMAVCVPQGEKVVILGSITWSASVFIQIRLTFCSRNIPMPACTDQSICVPPVFHNLDV